LTVETYYYLLGDIACSPQTYKHYAWTTASDYFTVEISKHLCTGNSVAEIINCEGIMVKKIELKDETPIIQINDLSAGLFILKLTNQKMKASKRFIKI
jgi:hypothetical protein